MDILSLITDPKVILIIVAIVTLAAFVYVSWKKTSSSISALENSQKKLQKQLAHGVITDERINPLRVENASNMSDDTMEYNYEPTPNAQAHAHGSGVVRGPGPEQEQNVPESELESELESESGSGTETGTCTESEMESEPEAGHGTGHGTGPNFFNQFQGLVQQHQQHQQHQQPSTAPLPGQNVLDELRGMRTKEDTVVIQEYETDSEEPIEFQDIRDYDFEPFDQEQHPLSIMEIKQQQLVEQKIKDDMERMDRENQAQVASVSASKPSKPSKPASVSVSTPKPKAKIEPKIKSKPKPKVSVNVSAKSKKPTIKPKIGVKA